MLFDRYRKLSQRDRALMDGRLITYHFYVGGLTLLVLGIFGARSGDPYPWVAIVFGAASLVTGGLLHVFHRTMVRGPQRDAYLATISAALGRHRFPLVPSLLGILVVFSLLVTVLYIVTG